MLERTFVCDICGHERPWDEHTEFDGQDLCESCLDTNTVCCHECGERLWADDNSGTRDIPLCQDCYDEHFTSCCRCGELIRVHAACYEEIDEYSDRPYCPDCFQTLFRDKPIHDYYYKPEPIFYGDGPRFFGVELEIDGGGEDRDNARALLQIANAEEELLYIKHDGSLDDGLELVTHPMTLDCQLHKVPWEELCRKAIDLGYLSHRAGSCGLHVHVNRMAFGITEQQQDAAIARVLYFFEKHWEELLKFSRRTPRQLERWAARYGYKEQPMEILDYAKKGYHGGRYTCVNLQNRSTVEFRMFRGTLKVNTILATLQLLDRICDAALCLSDDELRTMAWTTFVSGIHPSQFPQLVQYLKERRLYVNEPVESEVDA
ncbi:MAG: amidoligase family protein [Oscillospiraceae bacterium]|nr:amidoligase family protein [Oscillospiraceae bacterium]